MTAEPDRPNVSVVMIFLDAERFIAEAIESVLAQSYRDFELILVDDGSTDRSTEIARGYARRSDGRVRYTEHDGHRNLGMSASRNRGASVARGRFISFLDSDDTWLPERLSRYVAAIESFPDAGMLYGPTLYWYSWPGSGNEDPAQDMPGQLLMPVEVLIPPPEALRKWLETEGGCLPGIGSLIVRREAFDRVGGCEESFRGLYEDQAFLSKIAAHHPVVVIADVLDYYRQHPASACFIGIAEGQYKPNLSHPARKRYLLWLAEYLERSGLDDDGVLKALEKELWPYRSIVHGLVFDARRALPIRLKLTVRKIAPDPVWRALRVAKRAVRRLRAARFASRSRATAAGQGDA